MFWRHGNYADFIRQFENGDKMLIGLGIERSICAGSEIFLKNVLAGEKLFTINLLAVIYKWPRLVESKAIPALIFPDKAFTRLKA